MLAYLWKLLPLLFGWGKVYRSSLKDGFVHKILSLLFWYLSYDKEFIWCNAYFKFKFSIK